MDDCKPCVPRPPPAKEVADGYFLNREQAEQAEQTVLMEQMELQELMVQVVLMELQELRVLMVRLELTELQE